MLLSDLLAEEEDADKNASLVVTDHDKFPALFKDVGLTSCPTSSGQVSSTMGGVDHDVPVSTVDGTDR